MTILYVNGDSHAAAAEAVTPHAFAEDDPKYFYLGRAPHPDNLLCSWGKLLSNSLRSGFHCGAESASSNTRIMRTTREWLQTRSAHDTFVIIQWSTWERQEWKIGDIYYQITASGTDDVPEMYAQRYKEFVANVDWKSETRRAHEDIWDFHRELKKNKIKHIFFNGNRDFSLIQKQRNWGVNYIGPYDPTQTYDAILKSKGFQTVSPKSWHFGEDGHSYFNRFMLQYIITNKLI